MALIFPFFTPKKIAELALHVIVWLTFFVFPILLSGTEAVNMEFIVLRTWIPLFFYVVVFYSNYLYLIDQFLFTKQFFVFILWNVLLFVLSILLIDLFKSLYVPDRPFEYKIVSLSARSLWIYSRILISLSLTVGACVAIKTTRRWFSIEARQKQLENENLRSELNGLKYQLQPHFFFNTLNTIYSLVTVAPEDAKESIHRLGKLMRYLLYETEGDVSTLSKELQFIMNYIEVMKMRIPAHVKVDYEFPEIVKEVELMHLIFISLVENAFKHGISASEDSFISIDCKCTEDKVIFSVVNSNYPKKDEDRSSSGIGLENLRKRIHLNNAKKYNLKTIQNKNRFFATLEIRL